LAAAALRLRRRRSALLVLLELELLSLLILPLLLLLLLSLSLSSLSLLLLLLLLSLSLSPLSLLLLLLLLSGLRFVCTFLLLAASALSTLAPSSLAMGGAGAASPRGGDGAQMKGIGRRKRSSRRCRKISCCRLSRSAFSLSSRSAQRRWSYCGLRGRCTSSPGRRSSASSRLRCWSGASVRRSGEKERSRRSSTSRPYSSRMCAIVATCVKVIPEL
jgi:hypothetical protein